MAVNRSCHSASGFSLVETLVATSVLVTVMAGLADLLATSVRLTRDAGQRSAALDAAQTQIERLRARAWTFDADGAPVTDAALAASSLAALDRTTAGYSDWVDDTGQTVTENGSAAGVFLRRWSVTPLDDSGLDAIAIEVCVFRPQARDGAATGADVCLATIRARQP